MKIPNSREWEKHSKKMLVEEGTPVRQITAHFFVKGEGHNQQSLGIFKYRNKAIFCAWGPHRQAHCSYHAVRREDGKWLKPQEGCPKIQLIKEGREVVGIKISAQDYEREILFV